jgi:hypothetical protein
MLGRRNLLFLLALGSLGVVPASGQSKTRLSVFKDAGCGCCGLWIKHMESNGFAATATNADDMDAIKAKHGVPASLRSCHTTIVDGYVIEGHVPATYVQRLLKERPAIAGIGVPGMPIGSPGMEVAGMKPQSFDVFSFDKAGRTRIFASHKP